MANGLIFHISGGVPPMSPVDADFAFTIDFEKGAGDPRRIFDAASTLVDAFEAVDDALIDVVDSKIQTLMVLEDVEAGSLKVWLKNLLNRVPDEALKDLEWKKAVGHYLVKAKYLILKFCDDEGAGGRNRLDLLREELRELGRETDIRHLPDYAPIHEAKLVASLDQIQNAKRTLGPHDRLLIETDDRTYEVDLSKTWVPSESIQVADTQLTETHSDGELILTIRKADLLGQAMWQFSHGKTNVYAPIKDEGWLKDFHERRIALYSGDALRCKVQFTFVYDDKGGLIEQRIEIIKVLDVIKGSGGMQLGLTL